MQILPFHGPTGGYLQPPTGKAEHDEDRGAEGLMLPLRAAISKARKDNVPVPARKFRVRLNGTSRCHVEVIPLKNLRERCFLILFEDADKVGRHSPRAGRVEGTRLLREYQARIQTQSRARTRFVERASISNPSRNSTKRPTRNSKPPMRKSSPPMRNFKASMKNWKPPRGRVQ